MDCQVDYLNSLYFAVLNGLSGRLPEFSLFCCFVGIKAVIPNSSRYYKFASVE